jgi:hypothetical protein
MHFVPIFQLSWSSKHRKHSVFPSESKQNTSFFTIFQNMIFRLRFLSWVALSFSLLSLSRFFILWFVADKLFKRPWITDQIWVLINHALTSIENTVKCLDHKVVFLLFCFLIKTDYHLHVLACSFLHFKTLQLFVTIPGDKSSCFFLWPFRITSAADTTLITRASKKQYKTKLRDFWNRLLHAKQIMWRASFGYMLWESSSSKLHLCSCTKFPEMRIKDFRCRRFSIRHTCMCLYVVQHACISLINPPEAKTVFSGAIDGYAYPCHAQIRSKTRLF